MSKNSTYYLNFQDEDSERVEKTVRWTDDRTIRFAYDVDNENIFYRGIELEDFEKACVASRFRTIQELKDADQEGHEGVLTRFIAILEFNLFDGLYMGE